MKHDATKLIAGVLQGYTGGDASREELHQTIVAVMAVASLRTLPKSLNSIRMIQCPSHDTVE